MSRFKWSGVLWNFLLGLVFLALLQSTSGASIEIFQENSDNNSQQQLFASESLRSSGQNVDYFGEGRNLDETQTEIKSADEKTSFSGVNDEEDISFLRVEESKADVITLDSDTAEKHSTARGLSAKGYRGKTRKVTPFTSSATGPKPKSLSSSASTTRKDKDTTGKLLIASQPSRDLNFDEGETAAETSRFPYQIPLPYAGRHVNLDLSGRTKSLDVILAKPKPKPKRKFALDLGEYSKRRFRRDKKDHDDDKDDDDDDSDEEDDDDDKEGCKKKKHHAKPQDTILDDVNKFPNNLLQNQAVVLAKLTSALENIVTQLTFLKQKFTLRLIKITDKEDFNQMPNVLKDFNVTDKSPMFIIVGGIKMNSTSSPVIPPIDDPDDCESKPKPTPTTTVSSVPQTTLNPEVDLDPTTLKPVAELPTTTLSPSSEKPGSVSSSTVATVSTEKPDVTLPSTEKPNGELPDAVLPATQKPTSEFTPTDISATEKPVSELTPTELPETETTSELPDSTSSPPQIPITVSPTTNSPPLANLTDENRTSEILKIIPDHPQVLKEEPLIPEISAVHNLETSDTKQPSKSEQTEVVKLLRNKRFITDTNIMDFDVHSPTRLLSQPFTELFDAHVRLRRRTARTDPSFHETFVDSRDAVTGISESTGEREKDTFVEHVVKVPANEHPPGFVGASFAVDDQTKTEGEAKLQGSAHVAGELIIPQTHEQVIAIGSVSDAPNIDQSQSILSDVSLSNINPSLKERKPNGVENAAILTGVVSGNIIAGSEGTSNERTLQGKEFEAVESQDLSSQAIVSLAGQASNSEEEMKKTLSKETTSFVNDKLSGKSGNVNVGKVGELPSGIAVELNSENIKDINSNQDTPFAKEIVSLISESNNNDQQAALDATKVVGGNKGVVKSITGENNEENSENDNSSFFPSKVDAEISLVDLSEKENADSIPGSSGGLVAGRTNVDDSTLAVKKVSDNGNLDSSIVNGIQASKSDSEKVGNEKTKIIESVQDSAGEEFPDLLLGVSNHTAGLVGAEKTVVSVPVDALSLIDEGSVLAKKNSESKDTLTESSIQTNTATTLTDKKVGSVDSVIKEAAFDTPTIDAVKNQEANLDISNSGENAKVTIAVGSSAITASESTSHIDQIETEIPGVSAVLPGTALDAKGSVAESSDTVTNSEDSLNKKVEQVLNGEEDANEDNFSPLFTSAEIPLQTDSDLIQNVKSSEQSEKIITADENIKHDAKLKQPVLSGASSQNVALSTDIVSKAEKDSENLNAEFLAPVSLNENIDVSGQSADITEGKHKPVPLLGSIQDESEFLSSNGNSSGSTDSLSVESGETKLEDSQVVSAHQTASFPVVTDNVSIEENSNTNTQKKSVTNSETSSISKEEVDKSPLEVFVPPVKEPLDATFAEADVESPITSPLSLQASDENSDVIAAVALLGNSGTAGKVGSSDASVAHVTVDDLKVGPNQGEIEPALISVGTGDLSANEKFNINSQILQTGTSSKDEAEKPVTIENETEVNVEEPITAAILDKKPLDSGSEVISSVSADVDTSSSLLLENSEKNNIATKIDDKNVVGVDKIKLPYEQEVVLSSAGSESESADELQENSFTSTGQSIAPVSLNFHSQTLGDHSLVNKGEAGSTVLMGNSETYDPNQAVISVPMIEYPYQAVKPQWFDKFVDEILSPKARKEVQHSYSPIPISFASNDHNYPIYNTQ